MVIERFLKWCMGGGDNSAAAVATDVAPVGNMQDLEHFVDYVVRNVVDSPDAVRVEMVDDGAKTLFNIHCAKEDIGKVIGKNGQTVSAIRNLVAGSARRFEREINVEVVD
jgi:predicted RNA-binding protein YlqC (UPF0109 family)